MHAMLKVSLAPTCQRGTHHQIHGLITDSGFVFNLKKCLQTLESIDRIVTYFQTDAVPVSDVYDSFLKLPSPMDSAEMREFLNKEEIKYLQKLVQSRFEFMYGDAHGVGYLLDPRYIGKGLEANHKEDLEEFIVNFPLSMDCKNVDDKKEEIFKELTEYQIYSEQQKTNAFRFQMLMKKSKTILQYWQVDGKRWPNLQKLALKVYSMVASSVLFCAFQTLEST